MKEGDLCHFDMKPGWYVWFKHKIKPGMHPMTLSKGSWIVGVFQGDSPMSALKNGEVYACVIILRRKDPLTRIGYLPVEAGDLVYPQFYDRRSGAQEIRYYLCEGYDVIREVEADERAADIAFKAQFIPGICYTIDNNDFENERGDFRIDYRYNVE